MAEGRESYIYSQIQSKRGQQAQNRNENSYGPYYWITLLVGELGEAANCSREERQFHYRSKLIEVAASAIAAVASFDRQNKPQI